jgi:hypothetical protein
MLFLLRIILQGKPYERNVDHKVADSPLERAAKCSMDRHWWQISITWRWEYIFYGLYTHSLCNLYMNPQLKIFRKGKRKMKSLCLVKHKVFLGSGGIAPRILNFCTRWRCQLHAPVALSPRKEPPVPTGQKAGWAPEPD